MLRCYRVEVERLEKLKADLEASERHWFFYEPDWSS
jgi:hypothetical protein